MKRVGIVGAGIMASGMARNFLQHGYAVHIWNRSPGALEPLLAAGATGEGSPRAVAEASDVIIECVSDDDASRSVWTGKNGILAGASSEKVLITSASLSIGWIDELAELCQKKNLQFLDMPLTGSRGGAESGRLMLLVGGDSAVLDSIRPVLAAISTKIYHFGPAGAGMRFKLLLNTLSAIHMNAAAQAAVLAQKAGISPDMFYGALFDGQMGPASPATQILVRDKDLPAGQVNFALKWIEKDLRYAQAMAEQLQTSFDLLNATHDDLLAILKDGLADEDWSKISAFWQKHGGEV
jgi:3-hydroxyisobutyrate dehydrogenase